MSSNGINRFQGCLFMFLAVFLVIMFVPFLMGLLSMGLGSAAFLSTVPVMYIIIINVYAFLVVGREKNNNHRSRPLND